MRRDRGRAEEGPKRTQKKDPPWKTASTWRTGSSEEEEAGGASRQPRRFLKPKPDAGPTGGQLTPGPLPAPQRPSPALRKAAQVQRRISRRREEGAGHRAALLDASELSSAASDPHSVPGGSQDPTDRKGGLPGPAKRPSSRSAPKKDPRTPAAPLRPPSRAADHSPLATPGLPGISLEEEPRAIRSLDELFSEADQDQASLASSDSDFRVNVLSLDDLAPAGSIKEEEESREERARPVAEDPEKNPNAASLVPSAAAVRSVFSAPKDAVERGPPSREEEEAAGETEVSERLGSPSEAPPSSPGGTEYWDDFEPSSSSSPSSSSRASQSSSEEGAASEESRSKAPPPRSSRTGSSSLWQFSGTPKQRTTTTTDAAVQTNSPPPLSQWTQDTTKEFVGGVGPTLRLLSSTPAHFLLCSGHPDHRPGVGRREPYGRHTRGQPCPEPGRHRRPGCSQSGRLRLERDAEGEPALHPDFFGGQPPAPRVPGGFPGGRALPLPLAGGSQEVHPKPQGPAPDCGGSLDPRS
ncbi:uncharacterized protein C19orf44 homolog isoform X1 [Anolis carolinensis]|uniref:uncharacterized protein C19orf44 homolog isoform X1 n=1 Tax=Anolis carolinensis TaxID=28377 RepID=UPI002F2B2688